MLVLLQTRGNQGGIDTVGLIGALGNVEQGAPCCPQVCILALQDTANGQQYLVAFPAGRDWFGADAFDQYFYTTGRLLSAAERVALGVTDE